MFERIKVRGMVTVKVFDGKGNMKRHRPGFLRRLFGIPGRLMESRLHNIVTREGDAMIADALLPSPNKAKINGSNGHIGVGTGWTGNSTKTNSRCNSPAGSFKQLDSGYPQLKAAWGSTGDTTIIYRASFAAGALNANGINEACLLNGSDAGANCLAYAQLNPAANVTTADTLQVVWEITFFGQ